MLKIADVPDLLESKGWDRPSIATVRSWIRQGKIDGWKKSGRVYVEVSSLSRLETKMEARKENEANA